MKKTLLSLATLAALSASCGTEPDTVDVSTDTAIMNGVSNRVAAIVTQTNIVASAKDTTAEVHDPTLINAWGLVFSLAGPAWISVNGGGIANIYNKDGSVAHPPVIVPPKAPQSTPTGQVLNTDPDALFGEQFIFATEDGTVSGWKPDYGEQGMIHFSRDGGVFKGLALARVRGKLQVYVADFHDNRVIVLDDEYHPIHHHRGAFVDPDLPDGYAPFNILSADGVLFVSYAKQDAAKHDDAAAPGRGFVNAFEPDGDMIGRLVSRGPLDSPWGMAIMAPGKGHREERLLVGNFGNGRVNVFELERHDGRLRAEFEGALGDAPHHPIAIDGLWAIVFGSGVANSNFDADDIYFTAGPNGEGDGLFGELTFD